MSAGSSDPASRLCEIHGGVNMLDIPENISQIPEQPSNSGFSRCKPECKGVQTNVPVTPADYIALSVAKDEPCHVCGRRPTSSVKRGGGLYLCYNCLKRAKRPAKVQPLPGVLERSEENL